MQQFYDLGMCRFLGQLLVDRFAGDGLTSHSCWHSWEQERELVSQYTKITKIIEQHPIVFDFLLLLSELGFTGLCSVLPLFKALFVTVLSQLENTPLKTEKISFAFLQRSSQLIGLFICHWKGFLIFAKRVRKGGPQTHDDNFTNAKNLIIKLILIFIKADIFPRILSTFQKILSNSTNFEAFVLMRDLWDFLKLLIPTCEEITKGKMISFENKTVLEKREGKQLISSIVLVIQRNISLLGEFLYPILELICENDENDWTIEREQKPISVLAEIKRF
uniref:Integrator complex subunit 5 C-terminal domain-containing protein n=1 Tax=Meloidogyne incognita TaxID=6306 RepID=A0A914KNU8_MELIC